MAGISRSGFAQCTIQIGNGQTMPVTHVAGCTGSSSPMMFTYYSSPSSGTLQWQWKASASGTFSDVTGATYYMHTPAAAGYYRVVLTATGCNAVSDSVQVDLSSTLPVVITPSSATICSAGIAHLSVRGIRGSHTYTHSWYNGNSLVSNDSALYTRLPGNYSCVVTDANKLGCSGTSDTVVVTAYNPAQPTVSSPLVLCENDPPVALTAGGSNLIWYKVPYNGAGTTATPMASTAVAGNDTFYVAESLGGCESRRSMLVVEVRGRPAAPSGVSSPTYCAGAAPAALTATGTNLLWYDTVLGGTATAPMPSTARPGTDTFYVSQTVNGCQSPRAPAVVTVNALPPPPTVAPVTYCAGDVAVPLTAGGTNLLWYFGTGGGTGTATAPIPNTNFSGRTQRYVSQTVNGCESRRDTARIIVNPRPITPYAYFKNIGACLGDTVQLAAWGYVSSVRFTWNGPNAFTDTSWNFLRFNITAADTGMYYVHVTDTFGCVSLRDSSHIRIYCPDSVWPGDVNHDKLVDHTDALTLAMAIGSTGPARAATSILWQTHDCSPWLTTMPGYPRVNRKHADCDGDGTVAFSDTLAVSANYGMFHAKQPRKPRAKTAGTPVLGFDFTGLQAVEGQPITIPILFGSPAAPVKGVGGIAAQLLLEGITPMDTLALGYAGSWLNGSSLMSFGKVRSSSEVDWVYARTDQSGASGGGKIAHVTFTIPQGTAGTRMKLALDKVLIVDSAGVPLKDFQIADDSILIQAPPTTGIGLTAQLAPQLYVSPNPSAGPCFAALQLAAAGAYRLEIRDLSGRLVGSIEGQGRSGMQQLALPVASLSAGTYVITARAQDGTRSKPLKWTRL